MAIVGTYSQVLELLKDVVSCLKSRPKFVYTNENTLDWIRDKGALYIALQQMTTTAEFGAYNQPIWNYSVSLLSLKIVKDKADVSNTELEEIDADTHAIAQEFILKLRENASTNAVSNMPITLESATVTPLRAVYADVAYGQQIEFDLSVPDGYCFC